MKFLDITITFRRSWDRLKCNTARPQYEGMQTCYIFFIFSLSTSEFSYFCKECRNIFCVMKDENVSETSQRCFNLAYSRIHPLLTTVCVKTITANRLYIQMKLVY